jgi:AAA domain/TrwC relaxase
MLIDFMNMTNGEYHNGQLIYNRQACEKEIAFLFPNDKNPDLNDPKYRDIVKKMPYTPLIAGGLAKSLGIDEQFLTLELWEDLSNGYCPVKYLPKVNEAESLMRFPIETPRGLMVKLNKNATPIGEDGKYKPEDAGKDKRIGTEFVFALGRNTSNVLTAMEIADPSLETKLTDHVNKIFTEHILPEMERDAFIRTGTDGVELQYVKELLAVSFGHIENRGTKYNPQDGTGGPEAHKHWHFDLLNTAMGYDGKLLSVCNDLIIKNKDKYNSIFQMEMYPFLEKEYGLSFKPVYLDEDKDNEFLQDHEKNIASWDVEDKFIPESLRNELGARSKEMEALMKKLKVRGFVAQEIARKELKLDKTDHSPSELKAIWADKYAKHGFSGQSIAQLQNFNQVKPQVELPDPELMVSNYLRKHKDVVFSEDQIKAHVHKQLIGICDRDTSERHAEYVFKSQCHQVMDKEQREYFKDFLADTISDPELRKQKQLRFGRDVRFTTTGILMMDKYISESLKARESETRFVLKRNDVIQAILDCEIDKRKTIKDFQFSIDQKNAVVLAMTQPGAVMNIAGRAGSGKSTLLRVVKDEYERNGFSIIGTSPAGHATKSLAKDTGMKKGTFFNSSALIKQLELGKVKLTNKHVLFVDEAGMADTETLYKLIKAANMAGSKLILTGEKEQLQPVGFGNSYKVLNEQFTTAPVTAINRQRDHWQRELVEELASGQSEKALDRLYEKGLIFITKTEKGKVDLMVKHYMEDKTDFKQKFILAASNDEIDNINDKVRESLKKSGQLPLEEVTVKGKDGIDREFSVGDRIVFTKKQKSANAETTTLENSETGSVLSIAKFLNGKPRAIQIELDDGTRHFLNLKDEHSFQHAYAKTIHKSQGGTVENTQFTIGKNLADLHSSYVALSRHRGMARMYLSEEVVHLLSSRMKGKPPTTAMKNVAEWTAKTKNIELPPEITQSYLETRAWLTANYEEKDPQKRRKASAVMDDLKNVVEAFQKTNFKKTSNDFDRASGHAEDTYKRIRQERGYKVAHPVPVAQDFMGPPKPDHLNQVGQVQPESLSSKAADQAKELVRKAVELAQKAKTVMGFTRAPEAMKASINEIKTINQLPQMKTPEVKKPVFTPDLNNIQKPKPKRAFGKKKEFGQTM